MKKRTPLSLALLALLAAACSQGEKREATTAAATTSVTQKAPQAADAPLTRCDTAQLGGHTYIVTIARTPDKALPTVTDPLDQVFYDNAVTVDIARDGASLFSKTFRKEAFSGFLTESDRTSAILLGMAFDAERSTAATLCLAAQVGQPGTGEGPAFTVEIPAGGGAPSIVRDTRQDTMAEEGDERAQQ